MRNVLLKRVRVNRDVVDADDNKALQHVVDKRLEHIGDVTVTKGHDQILSVLR